MQSDLLKAYHILEEAMYCVDNTSPHEIEMTSIQCEIDFANKLIADGTDLLKKADVEKYRNAWERLKKQRQEYEYDNEPESSPLQDWEN